MPKLSVGLLLSIYLSLFCDARLAAKESVADAAPARFWHMGLVVRDLDLMHDFYSRIIGLQAVTHLFVEDQQVVPTREDSIRVAKLDQLMGVANTRLELRHYSDPDNSRFLELLHYPDYPAEPIDQMGPAPLGWKHLGIQVESLERVLEAMRSSGLGEVVSGPVRLPEFGNHRYVFIKDPEGNLLELFQAMVDTSTKGLQE